MIEGIVVAFVFEKVAYTVLVQDMTTTKSQAIILLWKQTLSII